MKKSQILKLPRNRKGTARAAAVAWMLAGVQTLPQCPHVTKLASSKGINLDPDDGPLVPEFYEDGKLTKGDFGESYFGESYWIMIEGTYFCAGNGEYECARMLFKSCRRILKRCPECHE